MIVKRKRKTPTASLATVFRWLEEGVFTVTDGRVFKGPKELRQRINCRRGMHDGDARVDLWHECQRRSCHVSQLVWMTNAGRPIPDGFEIHHRDENPHNNDFENLVCVHPMDHSKLHRETQASDIPF